nr:MAG TPA: hypothetical protein [Caudoviricetes sp.]
MFTLIVHLLREKHKKRGFRPSFLVYELNSF